MPRLRLFSLLSALGLTAAWFWLVSAVMADAATWHDTLAALPIVAFETQFGRLVLARLVLLGLALPPIRGVGLLATGLALALQPLMGHAGASEGVLGAALAVSEALHLFAAGAWLGGLAPLLMVLTSQAPEANRLASHRFSNLGFICVAILAATGAFQGAVFTDDFAVLFTTPYGYVMVLKMALFAVLLLLAAFNRWACTPLLPRTTGWLRTSVAVETGIGFAVVLAASCLASLPPTRF